MPNLRKRFPGGYVVVPISLSKDYLDRLNKLAKQFKVNRSEMVRRMIMAIELVVSQYENIPGDILNSLSSRADAKPEEEDDSS